MAGIITQGQCFTYEHGKDIIKGYFFTGIIEDGYMVMCEMVPPHKMNAKSFWKISESFFNESIECGKLELI